MAAMNHADSPNHNHQTTSDELEYAYWHAEGIERGTAAASYTDISRSPDDQIAAWHDDPELLAEAFNIYPLSGEWAGESIPEIFGTSEPTETMLEAYENGWLSGFFDSINEQVAAAHRQNLVADIKDMNPHQLANLAECFYPDLTSSSQFLTIIRDTVVEWVEEGYLTDDYSDDAHEIADGCVPVYTHEQWEIFTDLGLYQDSTGRVEDLAPTVDNLAAMSLYVTAETLATSLMAELTA